MGHKEYQKIINHCTKIIRGEVGYFNGWSVSEESEKKACEKAAAKILKYLQKKNEARG